MASSASLSRLNAVIRIPVPSALLSTSASPTCAPTLRTIRRGSITPVIAIPNFTSSSRYGVAANDLPTPASRAFSARAAQNFGQHLTGQSGLRPAYDIERGARHSAHRIDVRQRVGGGDLSVGERIVHHRREKIDRVDDREIVGKTEHSGVVAGGDSDQQIRMARQIEPREDSRQVRRTELTGSTRSLAPRSQAKGSARAVLSSPRE